MKQNQSSSLPPKHRFYLGILLAGVLAGTAITLLAWLQKWTPLRAPHGLYAALFWVGVVSVLVYGILLQRRKPFLSRLWIIAAITIAIGMDWLFPETLGPGCGGMPRAFAHWENQCITTCTTVCTWWVPLSDPTCAAQPHQPWDIGCCWTYGQSCTTSCSNVWVDDPPTVSGSVTCATPGNSGWCRGGASLDLTASDSQNYPFTLSGSIGGTPFSCSGASCTQSIPDGSGSASFTAAAAGGGNLSSSPGNVSYQVDSAAPALALAIPAPNGSNGWLISSPVTATASATDATSGVAGVSINGGSATFTATSDGVYPLTASATDNAGNSTTISGKIQIDSVPPSLSISAPPADGNGGWYVSPAVVTANASDATSGLADIQVRVDGGAWQDGSTTTISTDGSHTVEFQAWDQAGNSASTSPLTVKVDRTPPVAAVILPAPDGQDGRYLSPVTVTANGSDATSGVANALVSLDGNNWSSSLALSIGGPYTIQTRVLDNAGNVTTVSQTIQIDQAVVSDRDLSGNDVHATATIQVPYSKSTIKSTPSSTMTPPPTATVTSSAMPMLATPTQPSVTPLPPARTLVAAPKPQPRTKRSMVLWPAFGFMALLASLASASLSDPRPQAIKRFKKTLETLMGNLNQSE